jgi:hypothetical protein
LDIFCGIGKIREKKKIRKECSLSLMEWTILKIER